MQTILSRIAADKISAVGRQPVTSWKNALTKIDPTTDFSFGMLHAERLTKLLVWSMTADLLVEQAKKVAATADGEERRELATRWVERFEPRGKGVIAEIEATSGSLLQRLLGRATKKKPAPAAAE